VLGDPWVLLIIRDVLHGNGRFDGLRDNLGISEAVLSRRLRAMVEAELLTTVDYTHGGRTRQRYVATEAGVDLLPLLHQLAIWAEKHTSTPVGGGHMALIHETCGQETTRAETCSACGEPLRSQDMTWVKPWLDVSHRLRAAGG
jgi:DNA-binding HxlR family transcriptional regulator